MSSHPAILATALVMLVVGAVVLASTSAVAALAVGWALVGFAGVALVSLAFLIVGESEDRDRLRRPGG